MKRTVTILLLLAVLCQLMAQFGVLVYFDINQNRIAKTQCENIDKPQMHCDGKCVLTKMLKKAQNDEDNKKAFNSRVIDIIVFAKQEFQFITITQTLKQQNPLPLKINLPNPYTSIFHPPPIFV